MKKISIKTISAMTAILLLVTSVAGCSAAQDNSGVAAATISTGTTVVAATSSSATSSASNNVAATASTASAGSSALNTADLFSDRDLEQSADLSNATKISLVSDQDVTLSSEGVYVLSGVAKNVTIIVEAPEDAKVQIVLDGVSITNEVAPAIYVKAADKVFVTTTNSKNTLKVSGNFVADGDTQLDAVIFSRSDLTLNGTGTLDIVSSTGNGIASKDELKVTGGVYNIKSAADALEANDAILIYNGTLTIESGKDALHSENSEDASLGYIYIQNGTLNITAVDDAIRGNSFVQIDGGIINIPSTMEGIEANQITINGGKITLYAKNDGINATQKVSGAVSIIVNGGTISVSMASGDTDAFDSNGNITINGGTITVTAGSAFDANGTAVLNAGDVTVNGTKITQITTTQGGGGLGGKTRR